MQTSFESLKTRLKVKVSKIIRTDLEKRAEILYDVAYKTKSKWISTMRELMGKPSIHFTKNSSKWLRKDTGDTLAHLWVSADEIPIKKDYSKTGNSDKLTITVIRKFDKFKSPRTGFDYATLHNESSRPFGGYRERAYAIFDKMLKDNLKRRKGV